MKYIAFCGSLRKESLNKKLVQEAARLLRDNHSAKVEFIDLQPLNIPVYDGDIEAKGMPQSIIGLSETIAAAQGLIISTPEYNHSISSALKNTVDWLSRHKPVSLKGKHVLLLTASPGAYGGTRAMYTNRVPFEALGSFVYPTMLTLPTASEAFDASGRLTEERTLKSLTALLADFHAFAAR